MISKSISPKLSLLSRAFYGLFLLVLVASSFPFAPSVPLWLLRISDAFVSNAPVLLVSIALLLIGNHFQEDDDYSKADVKYLIVRKLGFWAAVCMFLIPLQFVSYGWFWVDSGTRLQQQISQTGNQIESLKQRIQASSSEVDLQREMAVMGLRYGQVKEGSLSVIKKAATKEIDGNYKKLKGGLIDQRNKIMADLLPGILKTNIGTIIILTTLISIRREIIVIK